MSFYHRYGAAAREERADFRHVKTSSSMQQTAMVFKRIYNLLPGSCSLRGNRPCGGGSTTSCGPGSETRHLFNYYISSFSTAKVANMLVNIVILQCYGMSKGYLLKKLA